MKRFPVFLTVLLVCGFFLIPAVSQAEDGEPKTYMSVITDQVPTFVDDIKPYVHVRPRYEWVDIEPEYDGDGATGVANALTIRSVIGAKIGSIFGMTGLTARIEATNVTTSWVDEFSTGSTKDPHGHDSAMNATVADSPMTRISQAYVEYNVEHLTTSDTTIVAGRKFINLDDHRHWGNVGWRQMPQSFGQVGLTDKTIPGLEIFGVWIYERRGINDTVGAAGPGGASPNKNNYDDGSVVINLAYDIPTFYGVNMGVTAYDFMIESRHDTWGGFIDGDYKITDDISVNWKGEAAYQSDPSLEADQSSILQQDINAYYYRAIIGADAYGFFVKGQYEVLGHGREVGTGVGNISGYSPAFTTPHATLHRHNGWADILAGQAANGGNPNGLIDSSFTVGYSSEYLGKLMFVYHDFRTETAHANFGSGDYGQEYDIMYQIPITKRFSAMAKMAIYDGDDGANGVANDQNIVGGAPATSGASQKGYANDVDKVWLMFEYKYN